MGRKAVASRESRVARIKITLVSFAIFGVAFLASVSGAEPGARPPQEDLSQRSDAQFTLEEFEKLRRGEILIKNHYRAPGVPEEIGSQIAAIVYLHSPIQNVWEIISNWKNYEKIIPNVKEVKLIEKEENRLLLYFNLYLSMQNVRYYLNYYFFKDKNLVTFQLDRNKENDFRRFHGYFKFDPVSEADPDLIQLIYSVDVELGAYFPEFIKSYFAKKDMPKVVANFKKWVERKKGNN